MIPIEKEIVGCLDNAILVINKEMNVVFFNPFAAALFSLQEADLNKNICQSIHCSYAEAYSKNKMEPACKHCDLIRLIHKTREEKLSQKNMELVRKFKTENKQVLKLLNISTYPISENRVVLSIEEYSDKIISQKTGKT